MINGRFMDDKCKIYEGFTVALGGSYVGFMVKLWLI
jgi:hypothetical protein